MYYVSYIQHTLHIFNIGGMLSVTVCVYVCVRAWDFLNLGIEEMPIHVTQLLRTIT